MNLHSFLEFGAIFFSFFPLFFISLSLHTAHRFTFLSEYFLLFYQDRIQDVPQKTWTFPFHTFVCFINICYDKVPSTQESFLSIFEKRWKLLQQY
jgi:hypothetical protein